MSKNRPMMPQGLRFDVFRRDNFCCRYCGRSSPSVTLEVDHVVAVSNGGTDAIDNLVTACTDCNRGKSAKEASAPAPGVKPRTDDPIVGMFGHSREADGRINWQFHITGKSGAFYTCQMFSWLDGDATNVKLLSADFIAACDLYATEDAWREQADMEIAQRQRDWRAQWAAEDERAERRAYLEDLWSGAND